MKYILRIDTPSVKKYLLATNKLKGIRGASAILDQLNSDDSETLVNQYEGEVFYLGGGGGLVGFSDEDTAQKFSIALKERYFQKTGINAVKTEGIAYDSSKTIGEHRELLSERMQASPPIVPLEMGTIPVSKVCSLCATQPISLQQRIGDELVKMCQSCKAKYDRAKIRGKLPYFQELLKHLTPEEQSRKDQWEPPETLVEIGEASKARKGYIGLVYADGNQMGRALDKLEEKLTLQERSGSSTSIRELYKQFSNDLDEALNKAAASTLVAAHPKGVVKENKRSFASEILFLGGDDLLLVCPADEALWIAKEIATRFEQNKKMKEHHLSLSVGVAIAKATMPIYVLRDQAEQLLKSAKKRSHWLQETARESKKGSIDFSILTASTARELEQVRKEEYSLDNGYKLTGRPYSIPEIEKLLKWARRFKKGKISVGRLSQLDTACRVSKNQGDLALYSLLGRMSKMQRKIILDVLEEAGACDMDCPLWAKRKEGTREIDYTVILDILEIYPFINEEGSND